MKYIRTDFCIPYYNFALEEMLLTNKKFDDSYILFYIHEPSVIIGKHQNAYEELNLSYIKENGIIAARRLSGGGAVYHDKGNLNYSFVTPARGQRVIDFARFTAPVLQVLKGLGVDAALSGRNDLCIGDKKFSGNAEAFMNDRILHHGTLMLDVDVERMVSALHVSDLKLRSKAVASVRSRVANLCDYLPSGFTAEKFKEEILAAYFKNEEITEYTLTDEDMAVIEDRVRTHFSLDSYNFGTEKKFSYTAKKRVSAGIIELGISTVGNTISEIEFSGDFFENKSLEPVKKRLIGTVLEKAAVIRALDGYDLSEYISGFSAEELSEMIFG